MAITGLLSGFNEQRSADVNYLAQLDQMRRAQLALDMQRQQQENQKLQQQQEFQFRQEQADQQADDRANAQYDQLGQSLLGQATGALSKGFADMSASSARAPQEMMQMAQMQRQSKTRNALADLINGEEEVNISDIGRAILPHDPTTGINLIKAGKEELRQQALLDRTGGTGVSAPQNYRWTKDGNLEPIPGGAADPEVMARMEAIKRGPNQKGANATEDERKAAGWLAQATNAYNNMANVMKASPEDSAPGFFEAAANSLGAEGLANTLRSPDRQKFVQAAGSFSEAALRAATGAGVNKDEAKQKIQELTPQFTDDLPVRQQKLESMKVYLDSLQTRAGRADTSFIPERADLAAGGQSQVGNWQDSYQSKAQAVSDALEAVRRGAPRDAVRQRLKQIGIEDARL